MKKLFTIKGIIAAVAVIFALSLTSCKKDGKGREDEGVVKVAGIKFTKTNITIAVNKTAKLEYTITPSNATNKEVTFTSDKESVAKVEASGVVKGISEGTAKITVTTKDGGFKATCNVTVDKGGSDEGGENGGDQKILVETITIEPTTKELSVGDSFQLDVTVLPANATDTTLTWTSSNGNVTVDLSGKITAVKEGSAIITATAKDSSGVKATCTVNCKEENLDYKYTQADYYMWDAPVNEPYPFTNGGANPNYNTIIDGKATQSCANAPTLDELKMYLGAGVYWVTDGPTYMCPDGKTYHTGLMVKKKDKIVGFEEGPAPNVTSVTPKTGVSYQSLKDDYFFLPACGCYYSGSFYYAGTGGYYWSSTPYDTVAKYAYYFIFNSGIANVIYYYGSYNYRANGFVPMPRL